MARQFFTVSVLLALVAAAGCSSSSKAGDAGSDPLADTGSAIVSTDSGGTGVPDGGGPVADTTGDTTAGPDLLGSKDVALADGGSCVANGGGVCPPAKATSGKSHGEPCTCDSECLYGFCKFGATQTNFNASMGICTKRCSCTEGDQSNVPCLKDDGATGTYDCLFPPSTFTPVDKKSEMKECARKCITDAECQAVNPAFTCVKPEDGNWSTGLSALCGIPKAK